MQKLNKPLIRKIILESFKSHIGYQVNSALPLLMGRMIQKKIKALTDRVVAVRIVWIDEEIQFKIYVPDQWNYILNCNLIDHTKPIINFKDGKYLKRIPT